MGRWTAEGGACGGRALLMLTLAAFIADSTQTAALAQTPAKDESADEAPADTAAPKKKRKKKSKARKGRTAGGETGSAAGAGAESGDQGAEEAADPGASAGRRAHSGWLPDWPAGDFDWSVRPIIGVRYAATRSESLGTVRGMAVEGGLAGGLTGIPVVAGNPGFSLGLDAGGAAGYQRQDRTAPDGADSTEQLHFRRRWFGVTGTLPVHWFRYRLGISRGRLDYMEAPEDPVQSLRIHNDFGFLLRSWWSAHYTVDRLAAFQQRLGDPFLTETDHWLHTRIFTEFLSFMFDLGPGVTLTEVPPDRGTTNYFKMHTQFTLFWKVVGLGQGKYAYDASEKRLGEYAGVRLPEEELNEPSTLTMPEDSFLGSFFLGVKDLIWGVGAGWRYNIQILHATGRDDTERRTTKDHGVGLYYEVRF